MTNVNMNPNHSQATAQSATPFLEVKDAACHFKVKRGWSQKQTLTLKAVDGVSFTVYPSETLAVVGESGCGKSSLANLIVGLNPLTSGEISVLGHTLSNISRSNMLSIRKDLQMVFQDPFSSLNPRMTIGALLQEPLQVHKIGNAQQRAARVNELLSLVNLPHSYAQRYPHQLSGGQRQRIGIARALAVEPKLIVCDEPVSSLDVSVQAQIINLLLDLQRNLGLSYVFIAHNLSVVKHIADRVAVMYLGRIVEMTTKEALFAQPRHPYTQMLLSSVPRSHPEDPHGHVDADSDLPSPLNVPSGCRFHTRCPYAQPRCETEDPQLLDDGQDHQTACHFWPDILASSKQAVREIPAREKPAYVTQLLESFDEMAQQTTSDN
ncbi:ABC transporter ATP-binding protein [Orrella sp. 11846]|uniref:ABC transporter ATP-binding protein n=1 Tax=Orrella sp. 11846 TaxID=3409913 RepID=UPI003B592C6C